MGRGGGMCSKVGGRENPAIAAWGVSAALLAAVSMTLFLLSEATQLKDSAGKGLEPEEYGEVMFVSRATFLGLGSLHAILCIASLLVTILGYFFWSQFLCFACPLVIINEISCLITASFGGYMLNNVYNYRASQVDIARGGGVTPAVDFSLSFADAHASLILLFSVASLAAMGPLSRAATIDEKGTMVDVMLHMPVITGCIGTSALFLFPSHDSFYAAAGAVWLLLAAAAAILAAFQKWGGLATRIFTLLLAVFYLFVFIFSAVSILVAGKHFLGGRQQVIDYVRTSAALKPAFLRNMDQDKFSLYKNYIIQNEGNFNLAAVILSSLLLVYSFMGALFSLRAVLGGEDALRRDLSSDSSNKD
ncbi:hypothetical protein, conserved [Eimeria brunetti]|uniref:Uncharacterized protein n=1 Tax=Eimeria brunetti TaxID=51314 RepID=U6L6V5_9EIME|nr:hypothetical protein, conserved [Eimeria brunetti]